MSTQRTDKRRAGSSRSTGKGSQGGRGRAAGSGSTNRPGASSSFPRYAFDGPFSKGQGLLAEAQRVLHVAEAGSLSGVSLSALVVALSTFLEECRLVLGPEAFEGSFGTHGAKTAAQAAFRKAEEVRRERRIKENQKNRERARVQRAGK